MQKEKIKKETLRESSERIIKNMQKVFSEDELKSMQGLSLEQKLQIKFDKDFRKKANSFIIDPKSLLDKRAHYTLKAEDAIWFDNFLASIVDFYNPDGIKFPKFVKLMRENFTPEELWTEIKNAMILKMLKNKNEVVTNEPNSI